MDPTTLVEMSSAPPPPPTFVNRSPALSPPTTPVKRSAASPPPPPPMPKGGNILSFKKVSKLKRSRQMGELYRHLKLMLEGSNNGRGGLADGKIAKSDQEETEQALPPSSTLSESTTVLEIATPALTNVAMQESLFPPPSPPAITNEAIANSLQPAAAAAETDESIKDSSLALPSTSEVVDDTIKDSPIPPPTEEGNTIKDIAYPPAEADDTMKDSSTTSTIGVTKAIIGEEIKDSSPTVVSQPPVRLLPRLLPSRFLKESSYHDEQDHGSHGPMNELSTRFVDASPYFRRIEEDAEKYTLLISDIEGEIISFESNDMAEIVKFRQYIDQRLNCLFDESKVLARFDGFPSEKLERIRTAAGRICKLETILFTIKDWKLMSPVYQPLEKIEIFFNKIWREMNEIDLAKDEERKRFVRQNINFDVGSLIITIKESLVDLSSNCIELALKENEKATKAEAEAEASASANKVSKMLMKGSAKRRKQMMWNVFQFAYRVYNFAGGQDDQADLLTVQLAHEIETLHKIK